MNPNSNRRTPHVPSPAAEILGGANAELTIPFPPDLFEALAQRIAEILAERPAAQRFMDSDTAAAYLGIPAKTLKTREWRDAHGVPYSYLGGKLVFDRLALDERFASSTGSPGGRYAVTRVATGLAGGLV